MEMNDKDDLKEMILSTLAEMKDDDNKEEVDSGTVSDISMENAEVVGEVERESVVTPNLHNLSTFNPDEVLESINKKDPPLMPMAQEVYMPEEIINEEESKPTLQKIQEDEQRFLEGLRERILVMFEGMQSPNNRVPEAKIDLILNFFEWQLAMIDERLERKGE
ncbi:hypothetical protein CCZ01_01565 [Helicobacter monodelphidis]|uniref:CiaD-like domain-containing protein n=1 Tax=Helicobacter sp. 15-1451 TaxID=2004995 RepID=UPI000DCCFC19|nr:hypothetical protein [Helicobacter sp. 15-1451]RAX58909.1 hypothetical protein CCZ01_01565 [Helicobacter sp. 15-1451]